MNTLEAAVLVQLLLATPPLATFWLTQQDPEGGLSAPGLGVLTWQGLAAMALVCVLEWLLIRRERLYRARKAAPPETFGISLGAAPKVWHLTAASLLVFYWFGGRPWPALAGFAAATALGCGLLMVEGWQGRRRGASGAVPGADTPLLGGEPFGSLLLSSDDEWRRQRS